MPQKVKEKSRGISPLRGLSPFQHRRNRSTSRSRSGSVDSYSSQDSRDEKRGSNVILSYDNARRIVFRDDLKRATKIVEEDGEDEESLESTEDEEDSTARRTLREAIRESIRESSQTNKNLFPESKELNELAQSLAMEDPQHLTRDRNIEVQPLDPLPLDSSSKFKSLLESGQKREICQAWTHEEKEVFELMKNQRAVVKTIRYEEWQPFLGRFLKPSKSKSVTPCHADIAPCTDFPFNSFRTSTTLLPELGRKMRCYGSETAYNIGVVFALPDFDDLAEEDSAARRNDIWAWPAGYAAKTEFNINNKGQLINGRKEALVSLETLRSYNDGYVNSSNHFIAGKMVQGGPSTIPYNEVLVRVGGCARAGDASVRRSFAHGIGLPIGLFIRSNSIRDVVSLFRTRARMSAMLGKEATKSLPLFLITPELGALVFTEALQTEFWEMAAKTVQPFQNPTLQPLTQFTMTKQQHLQVKKQELIDLTERGLSERISPKMKAIIAGGFGVTDESLAEIFESAFNRYSSARTTSHDFSAPAVKILVMKAFAAAVRSDDHLIVRQILLIYSWVAQKFEKQKLLEKVDLPFPNGAFLYSNISLLSQPKKEIDRLFIPSYFNTDFLRAATNSDGILVSLGASQVLRSLHDGSAQERTRETISAVQEWVDYAEQSVAFRLASWRNQRAAVGDALAVSENSKMLAFAGRKAIHNRKKFIEQLQDAVPSDFSVSYFLHRVHAIIDAMHSPCLRLELLQYVLGLDNRYSAVKVNQSIELASTCLSLAEISNLEKGTLST